MKGKTIIGIDPGTRITGFGVLVFNGSMLNLLDCGTIRPPIKEPLASRYLFLFQKVGALIDRYGGDALAIETQYVEKNIQSAMKLGMAKAAVMIAAASKGLPLFEYSPTQAKKAVVGRGKASKFQVQEMIRLLLGLQKAPSPQDVTDALALAICHAHNHSRSLYL